MAASPSRLTRLSSANNWNDGERSDLMTADDRQYRAFISYSHKDKEVAAWLHKVLEGYRVPQRLVGASGKHGVIQKRLGKVFRDREDLAVSSDLSGKINEALQKSHRLIVICSPESAK